MEKIINLTQHACSNEQASEGVVEPSNKKAVQAALTFVEIPTKETILASATTLAKIASQSGAKKADWWSSLFNGSVGSRFKKSWHPTCLLIL